VSPDAIAARQGVKLMARPRKFDHPHNITFTLDQQELQALRAAAHDARERSLSAFIRTIVVRTIRRRASSDAADPAIELS